LNICVRARSFFVFVVPSLNLQTYAKNAKILSTNEEGTKDHPPISFPSHASLNPKMKVKKNHKKNAAASAKRRIALLNSAPSVANETICQK
jgi:hypothetical protein